MVCTVPISILIQCRHTCAIKCVTTNYMNVNFGTHKLQNYLTSLKRAESIYSILLVQSIKLEKHLVLFSIAKVVFILKS